MAQPLPQHGTNDPRQSSGQRYLVARIDRLPLTSVHWRLALLSQLFWGVLAAATFIPAQLYPFVWGPEKAFGLADFSWLLAVQFGVGILVGGCLSRIVAERWGRRSALLISLLAAGLWLWPTALTDNFGVLLVCFGLSSIGLGGALSANVMCLSEITPRRWRGWLMLRSQVLGVLVFGLCGNVPAMLWLPQDYQRVIGLFSLVIVGLLVPLAAWCVPESPLWLEARGRRRAAYRVVLRLEEQCLRRTRLSRLRAPDYTPHAVSADEPVSLRGLLRSRYGQSGIVLLIAWILGYSGIVYGFAGFEPAILHAFGLNAAQTFGVILVSSVFGDGLALLVCSLLRDAVEQRVMILSAALLNFIALAGLYFVHTVAAAYLLITLSWSAETAWLFGMYTYTAVTFPPRLRESGTELTEAVARIGAMFGPIVVGALYVATANVGYYGWFAYIMLPGALLPALLVAWSGIDHRRAMSGELSF